VPGADDNSLIFLRAPPRSGWPSFSFVAQRVNSVEQLDHWNGKRTAISLGVRREDQDRAKSAAPCIPAQRSIGRLSAEAAITKPISPSPQPAVRGEN